MCSVMELRGMEKSGDEYELSLYLDLYSFYGSPKFSGVSQSFLGSISRNRR